MFVQTNQFHVTKPKVPPGTRTSDENKALKELRHAISHKLALGYRPPQFQLLNTAVEMINDATDENWDLLASKAAEAIDIAQSVTSVTPYIFHSVTESSRILPSEHRHELKKMLQRRFAIRMVASETELAKLFLQRCAIAAAISAEKGAIHIARQNLGAILQQLHSSEGLRGSVKWTEELLVTLGRTHGNTYQAP